MSKFSKIAEEWHELAKHYRNEEKDSFLDNHPMFTAVLIMAILYLSIYLIGYGI